MKIEDREAVYATYLRSFGFSSRWVPNNRRKDEMKLLIASVAALAIASPALAQTTPPASNDTMTTQSTSTSTTTTSPTKVTKKHKVVRHHKPMKHRKHRTVRHTHTTKVKAHVTATSTTKS